MNKLLAGLVLGLGLASSAMAFPSWIGTYGNYKKHDDRINPGQFSILMNQDYVGLKAEVGVQVNGGNWVAYPMNYAGNVQGNSYWTFTPSFQFPGGAVVKYYFHGFDNHGGHIYDSRNSLNYEFTVSPDPAPIVKQIAAGEYTDGGMGNGITATYIKNLWLDFKIRNIGEPQAIGIIWTWNNWADWRAVPAVKEATLAGGEEQWGVDIKPMGTMYYHRSMGFIRWFPETSSNYVDVVNGRVIIKYAIFYQVGGTWYWDNNGGADYSLVLGNSLSPDDLDNDGLSDAWENEHFGNLSQGATDNPDGDGVIGIPMDNMIEYLTSNHPNVPNDPTGVRLMWANSYPSKGGVVTLSYSMGNEGNPLFGKPVYAHVGQNGWKNVYTSRPLQPNGQNGRFEILLNVPADATELNVVFTDTAGHWDNNGGKDWKILVRP